MTRNEIIKSLRCCMAKNGECESNCPRFNFRQKTGAFIPECEAGLMFRAANMLEQESTELENVDSEKICNQLNQVIAKIDAVMKME